MEPVGSRPHEGDDRLIELSKQGDVRAYGALVSRYEDISFRTAYAITRSAADAEDAAQEAFVKAYLALGRFRRDSPFRPWLLRIMTNEARNRRRSTARIERLTLRAVEAGVSGGAAPSPEVLALERDDRLAILAAVDDLRERDREVIVLRYLLELSKREVAEILGCAVGTVKSRLSRALERLRRKLAASGIDPSAVRS